MARGEFVFILPRDWHPRVDMQSFGLARPTDIYLQNPKVEVFFLSPR